MFKVLLICGCLLAVAQAGVIGTGYLAATAPGAVAVQPAYSVNAIGVPTIAASSSNIIRGIGNLGTVSADARAIDTPYSSVRNADVRVTNSGIVGPASGVQGSLVAVNAALAGPALVANGYAANVGAGPAYAGLAHIGLNGLALNGLGHIRVI